MRSVSNSDRKSSRWIFLLGIILVAFALRVYNLDQRTLWYDEAFSVFLAQQDMLSILRGTAADIQPPLYYLLLHVWQTLGGQLYIMRFLSVAFSLLCLPLVYALGRLLLSTRAGLWAMFFVALAPFQIAYAQELRMYSLLAFGFMVYGFAFVRLARGDGRFRNVLWLALSGAIGLYSQSLAILTFVVPDAYAVYRRDAKLFRRLVAGQFLGLILFAPWLIILFGQLATVQRSYWTAPPGIAEAIQLLLAFTIYQPLPTWFLPIALFVTLSICALAGVELAREHRRNSALAMIAVFIIIPPILLFGLSYIMRSIFVVRAVILSSLAFTLLLGWLVARIRIDRIQLMLAVVWLVVVFVALAFQFNYDEFPRPPFKSADAYLRENVRSDDVIVHDNKLSYLPMRYYDRSLPQVWLADPPGAGSDTLSGETMRAMRIAPVGFENATQHASRIWFIIFQRAIDEAQAENQPPSNLLWLDQHYKRSAEKQFNDLNVLLYQPAIP